MSNAPSACLQKYSLYVTQYTVEIQIKNIYCAVHIMYQASKMKPNIASNEYFCTADYDRLIRFIQIRQNKCVNMHLKA